MKDLAIIIDLLCDAIEEVNYNLDYSVISYSERRKVTNTLEQVKRLMLENKLNEEKASKG